MRVLIVNHRFYPVEGGTERWALGLARGLRRKGEEVTVLTQSEPGVPDEETVDGIAVRRIPMAHWGGVRFPRGYWRTLRALDYDLLNMSGNRIWCADFYFPVAEVFDGPQVITPHDFYQWVMHPTTLDRWYFTRYLPGRLKAYDAYLAHTPRERDRVVGWGYPLERTHVVGTAVELSEFARPRRSREEVRARWGIGKGLLAYYVGGLWENKRVDRLVRALAPVQGLCALAVAGRDVPGSPYGAENVRRLAKELGVEVHVLGEVPRDELISGYHAADVFLLGSAYEGFGLGPLEAMACGLPFVSYDVGGASLLAQGGGGKVATTDHEFASAVAEVLKDDGLRHRMAQAARTSAQNWDWSVVAERYRSVYRLALDRHASS